VPSPAVALRRASSADAAALAHNLIDAVSDYPAFAPPGWSAPGVEAETQHLRALLADPDARYRSAREMYEALHAVRSQLKIAKQMIKKVGDKQRRADLMDLYANAEVPVTRAVNAGHTFVYDELQAHLATAQARVDKLMGAIGSRVE